MTVANQYIESQVGHNCWLIGPRTINLIDDLLGHWTLSFNIYTIYYCKEQALYNTYYINVLLLNKKKIKYMLRAITSSLSITEEY